MEFDLNRSVEVLERTPKVLDAMLSALSDDWLRSNEGPDTFSPFDVLAHLIGGEENDWIPRAKIILAGGPEPRFHPFDRYGPVERASKRSPKELLEEFGKRRADNLHVLKDWKLTPGQLAMRGIHPKFGDVTLRQLLATWVAHDLGHLAQIARVMAKQYRVEVGPWIQFLPVLTDRPVPAS
jgi:hypothetical protein